MTELVREDGNNFLFLALLNQCVIDDNVLLPRKTEEISVTMRAALTAIDDEQFLEREVKFLCQRLGLSLQFAFLQRGQLVEKRQNEDGVDRDGEDLKYSGKEP